MIRKTTHSHPAFMAVSAALVIFLTSLFIYDRIQIRTSIINLTQTVVDEKIARRCSESESRLILKISVLQKFTNATNLQITSDILASYQVALSLAEKGDLRCVIMEEMGDSMLRAYRAGVKDGAKNSNFGGV